MLNQLNFSSIVSSGSATTQLGVELMERYLGALQRNGESHILVNSFVKEASRLQYDAGIRESLEKVASFIGEQPIKWTLATRCESILDGATRDRHARPAATKASGLLELEEGELVSAIRAGALREVMHCEAFRSLANQVLGEIQTVVRTDEYTITHPLSYVEKAYDGIAVRVCGRNICQDDEYNLIPNYQASVPLSSSSMSSSRVGELRSLTIASRSDSITISSPSARLVRSDITTRRWAWSSSVSRPKPD